MGDVFNIRLNTADLSAEFHDMNTALKRATVNSLNKVGRLSNKGIATYIKENYNIKARSLKLGRTVSLRRADARKLDPRFLISVKVKGRGLAVYDPQKTPAGISVKVKKSRKTVRKAFFIRSRKNNLRFVAVKGSGNATVDRVSRTGRSYKGAKSRILWGAQLSQLYASKEARRVIEQTVDQHFKGDLAEQFDKQFERRRF